jgi:CBS domain-containing protein
VIYLTEMLGLPAVDSQGQALGRVREVALTPSEDLRRVSFFLVRRGKRQLEVPYDSVATVSSDRKMGMHLTVRAAELNEYDPSAIAVGEDGVETAHLFISRDLLDQQIIDVDGRKVVRVNDVHFQEQSVNGGQELRVAEVEVGLTGAVRRLFQGVLPAAALRALEPWLSRAVIPWDFVDLIETDPLRRVKLKITHEKLARLHPADLADIVEELAPAEREAIFESLDEAVSADALSEVEPKVQKAIVESLDTEKAADILEEMDPDEAADLLAELSDETSEEILDDMETKEAREIEELLEYHERTAGGLMTKDFVAVPEAGTVDSAVEALRADREVAESTNTIFVLDAHRRLTGAIPLVQLFLSPPSTQLAEIKPLRLIFAHLDAHENEVVELFDKYNLLSLPVIDEDYHLAGVITADDIISVLRARK